MTAYNPVNGTTMTEHRYLVNEVLRGEWGFDGFNVSDWMAARSTVGDIEGGLDVAMPGPTTVYGEALAAAVRAGEVAESMVDDAVRNVLRLAARVGILDGAEPAVTELPADVDGEALAREIARRAFVLVRNEGALPVPEGHSVALIGAAARDARVLGGGSAVVFPARVVSPLDGLTAALPEGTLTYAVGADPNDELAAADKGFELRAVCRDADGTVLGTRLRAERPHPVDRQRPARRRHPRRPAQRRADRHLHPARERRAHLRHPGPRRLHSHGRRHEVFDGRQRTDDGRPVRGVLRRPRERATVDLTAARPTRSRCATRLRARAVPMKAVAFSLAHLEPRHDPDELIAEAVEAARAADTAVVVVATTERVESEGFDRKDLRLPGRQDDLVRAVAAANPNTVVVVNSGSPVELPWRDDVAAVLLSWFPGQEGGAALADVLLGTEEPGGRLPTTWGALADAPVTEVTPTDGELPYTEGVFIGYRAWEKAGRTPRTPSATASATPTGPTTSSR